MIETVEGNEMGDARQAHELPGEASDLLRLATPDDRVTLMMLERVQAILPGNSDLDGAVKKLRDREEALARLADLPATVVGQELAVRQRILGGAA